MPKQKKPTTTPTTSLRRSPRFLPQPPTTLNPQSLTIHNGYSQNPTKPTENILVCGVTSIGSRKSPRLRNVLSVSKYSERCELLNNSDSGFRKSARFRSRVSEGFSVRRSPRFVLKGNNDNTVENCVNNKLKEKRGGSKKLGSDKGVFFSEERGEKAVESCEKGNESGGLVVGCRGELERDVLSDSLGDKSTLLDVAKDCGNDDKVRIGRKREIREEEGYRGWSKEQEMALQRAYFAAKPTPNFWKKVSKLVPGKSAQDCFDKIHSDHITPLHPLPRSRARKMNSSPIGSLSLSASKLLNSSGIKTKRPISNKQTSRLVHRTVRQLLQKCNRVEKDYEADLFSALEPTVNPSIPDSQVNAVLSTPIQEKQKCLQKYDDKDSDLKKRLSKSSSSRINLLSPPVLKQVKNRSLHEKYIDHLHTREAKRNAAAKRAGRLLGGKENLEQTNIQNMDIVKSAKDALVSDARDGIKQLEHLQANATETCSDFDDDCIDSMEDEAECGI